MTIAHRSPLPSCRWSTWVHQSSCWAWATTSSPGRTLIWTSYPLNKRRHRWRGSQRCTRNSNKSNSTRRTWPPLQPQTTSTTLKRPPSNAYESSERYSGVHSLKTPSFRKRCNRACWAYPNKMKIMRAIASFKLTLEPNIKGPRPEISHLEKYRDRSSLRSRARRNKNHSIKFLFRIQSKTHGRHHRLNSSTTFLLRLSTINKTPKTLKSCQTPQPQDSLRTKGSRQETQTSFYSRFQGFQTCPQKSKSLRMWRSLTWTNTKTPAKQKTR